jgi:putative pyoverdin transport system ATP-binding/permease protein
MKFVWKYLKPSLLNLLIGTSLSTLSGLSIIWVMKEAHQSLKSGIQDPQTFFIILCSGLIVFFTLGIISEKILTILANKSIINMRMNMAEKLFEAEFEKVEFKKEAFFSSIITDINAISRIVEQLPSTIKNATISIGGIMYLFTISWQLTLLLFLIFACIYLVMIINNKMIYVLTKEARKKWDVIYHSLYDVIYGIKELSLNDELKKKYLTKYVRNACDEELEKKVKLKIQNHTANKLSETILFLGIGLIMISSVYFQGLSSIGIFTEFLTISLFLINPISGVAKSSKSLIPLKAITEHIEQMGILLDDAKQSSTENISTLPSANHIKIDHVCYSYLGRVEDSYFELGPLSFEIPTNKITLIYGNNGSGKTTIAKIIAGLYNPTSGSIFYGETEITLDNRQQYRNKISAVFTDNHIFSNLEYISSSMESEVTELLKLFQIDQYVSFSENKFSTTKLSSGQTKRLSLIISLLEDKEIYIFDEWAANQDPNFKKAFYDILLPRLISKNKTVILITHDDQYFHIADYRIHLTDGRIS